MKLILLMQQYLVTNIYTRLVGDQGRLHWDKYAWNRLAIPKHRFFLWMALKQRLQTTALMHRFGVSDNPTCLICGREDETQEHLLFRCCYSASILVKIKTCGLNFPQLRIMCLVW